MDFRRKTLTLGLLLLPTLGCASEKAGKLFGDLL
jgi:hypothetical protein